MQGQRTVYTPSELNHEARLHLEAGFGRIWLEGEISNLSRPASGHLYFSLKDDKAQISCAFFRSGLSKIQFRPENGMQVQARGRLSLYEARGNYQLIVDAMEDAGEGRLRAAVEALKIKLRDEGLFDPGRKQAMPDYPLRIAVITSASGAVIRDILNVLKRRWPLASVRLYPVAVQGQEAALAICIALKAANQHGWAQAIIVGRGGGSLEDLQAFNDESVARAIAGSAIPVISAVGHETDFSISDFVADLRAPTPSAAAELLTPDSAALKQMFFSHFQQLQKRMAGLLQNCAQKHDQLVNRLNMQHPGRKIHEQGKTLAALSTRLNVSGKKMIPRLQRRLGELARTLNAVSPLLTLDRGYAILAAAEDGAILTSVAGIQKDQAVSAQLGDGRVYATVDKVTDEKPGNDSKK